MSRSLFLPRQRLVDGHDVDGRILVSVHKTMFLASQYAMDLLGLVQNYALVPFLGNARHDVSMLTLTATLGCPVLIYQRYACSPDALQSMTKPGLRRWSVAATGC